LKEANDFVDYLRKGGGRARRERRHRPLSGKGEKTCMYSLRKGKKNHSLKKKGKKREKSLLFLEPALLKPPPVMKKAGI